MLTSDTSIKKSLSPTEGLRESPFKKLGNGEGSHFKLILIKKSPEERIEEQEEYKESTALLKPHFTEEDEDSSESPFEQHI
jgi:hypothetical protein